MKLNRTRILMLLSLAQLLVVIDSVIVNLALPAIKADLHFDDASLQWVLTAYILTFGGFLMIGGRLADLYGRRRILTLGIAGFALCSLLLGLTRSAVLFIVLRALEGLAAAVMSPAALSILLTSYEEGDERNRALSVWSVVISGGAAFGVILGGVLTQYAGWRWNFFINVPIGLFAIFGILKWVPAHDQEAQDRHLDLPGAIWVTGGLVALVYALTLASRSGWGDSSTLILLLVSLVLLGIFLFNEARSKHPLMPLSIFRIRNVSGGNLMMLLLVGASIGTGFFMSLYIQNVLRYSPSISGLSFLPIPIIIGVISTRAPRLIERFGFKLLLVIGTAFMALAVSLMSLLRTDANYLTQLFPIFVILAVGDGLAFVAGTVAATTGVRDEEAGLASGLVNTSQQVGGALGLAVLAQAANVVISSSLAAGQSQIQANWQGYQQAFFYAAIMLVVALIVTVLVIRAPRTAAASEGGCTESQVYGVDC
ncbi:MAG TPA: MFS transporter [Aggregatilineaceae bacterium]|nr:MFS transporter [Aggregatilineaceae bacterium]